VKEINMTTLQRDCLTATLVSVVTLGLFQAAIHQLSVFGLVAMGSIVAVLVFWSFHRMIQKLDEKVLQLCIADDLSDGLQQARKENFLTVQDFPALALLEQFAVPLFFITRDNTVSYQNLSFDLLLIRHQAWIKMRCPQIDVSHAENIQVEHFLNFISRPDQTIEELLAVGTFPVYFGGDVYHLSLQAILDSEQKQLGTMVWLQEAEDNFKVHPQELQTYLSLDTQIQRQIKQYDHVALRVDPIMKQAEDVLLEDLAL
jgi:hypothetical protein